VLLHGLSAYRRFSSNSKIESDIWQREIRFVTLVAVDANESYQIPEPQMATVADLMVTPNNPPWNGWVAIAVWILSIVFIIAVPAIFLVPYLISKGINFGNRAGLTDFITSDQTAILLQLAPIVLAHILTVAVGWFVVTKFNRYPFRSTLGWKMGGFRVWHAVAITFAFYAVSALMTWVFGSVPNDFEKLIDNSRAAVYLVAFFATFTAPLVEELVYRGLLYSAFQRRFGFTIGVIFVTVLFTAVHVPQYSNNGVPDFASIFTLLLLSLLLTLIRAWTGNLLPCIVLHTVFNGTQSIFLILQPYLKSSQTTPDPTGFVSHLFK